MKRNELKATIYFLFFVVLVLGSIALVTNALEEQEQQVVTGSDSLSNPSYVVYLKENDTYATDTLESGNSYFADLIDKIVFTYKGSFKTNIEVHGFYADSIKGNLIITDKDNKLELFNEEYDLVKEDTHIIQNNAYENNQVLELNYEEYNNKVKEFKETNNYTNIEAKLVLTYSITRSLSSTYLDANSLNKSYSVSTSIPLATRTISITNDTKDISESFGYQKEATLEIKNMTYLYIAFGCSILSLLFIALFGREMSREKILVTNYDIELRKLNKEYDRLIVNVYDTPSLKNVKRINSFNELLDLKDNCDEPICFYEIKPHKDGIFYINLKEEYYVYELSDQKQEEDE